MKTLISQIESNGWKKRSPSVLTMKIDDGDFEGWLGLNIVKKRDKTELNLVAGIRCLSVENLLASCCALNNKNIVPTVSISTGYLFGHDSFSSLCFDGRRDEDVRNEAMTVVKMVECDFVKQNASLSAVLNMINNPRFTQMESRVMRLPIIKYLLGDADWKRTLDEFKKDFDGRSDLFAKEYVRFYERMLSQV